MNSSHIKGIHPVLALTLLTLPVIACTERPLPIPPRGVYQLKEQRAIFEGLAPAEAPLAFRVRAAGAPGDDAATHSLVFDEVFQQNARNTPNTRFELSARWSAALGASGDSTSPVALRVFTCNASTTPKSPEIEAALCGGDNAETSSPRGGSPRGRTSSSPAAQILARIPGEALTPGEARPITMATPRSPAKAEAGTGAGTGARIKNSIEGDGELLFAGYLVEGERRYPVLRVEFSAQRAVVASEDPIFKGILAATSEVSAALIFNEGGAGLRALSATSVLRLSGPVQTHEGEEIDHIQQCFSSRTVLTKN